MRSVIFYSAEKAAKFVLGFAYRFPFHEFKFVLSLMADFLLHPLSFLLQSEPANASPGENLSFDSAPAICSFERIAIRPHQTWL
jgi:hypothetical protein